MCGMFRRLKQNPNYPVLVGILSVGAFAIGAALLVWLDWTSGSAEQRWGLNVWGAFVTGLTFAIILNICLGLAGILCSEE